ncbi:putative transferase CAF17 homolog, mitochondrial isoform X2 [Zootermopsis nevadensis]|nr:putative transferase CAF17 homolog, mitochondrial isoform X2 [Zootermopsis nevadensis]XP_021939824.1 putative transferase CAF17 homolog, mitochondrial isoform X2 [Zootermopsis nevadensis]
MLQMSNTTRLWLKHFSDYCLPLKSFISRNVTVTTKKKSAVVECLKSRGILRVSGKEASSFMQGLITNDMRHLEEGVQSMYTTFLNTKGRVMYDAIIYQSKEENVFLIECDKSAISHLQKHLKLFRVRRKIDIDNVEDELKVWVVFDPNLADTDETNVNKMKNILQGQILSPTIESPIDESIIKELEKHTDNTIVCRDPRLSTLGVRIVAPASEDISLQNDRGESVYQGNNMSYRAFRYKLGIGEGVNDLPPENCFPLEANGDYLHGVSFHKGCYIGQELTARTHHTGVVRKRLMPIIFESVPQTELEINTPIHVPSGCNKVSVGKLRGVEGNVGLALLRIAQALDASEFKILNVTAETTKPHWWPQEAPKDRIFTVKG